MDIIKISKMFCYQDLAKENITIDNVHEILVKLGNSTYAKMKGSNKKERLIIIYMTKRFGGMLHASWDRIKKTGVKRTREESLYHVQNFINKNKYKF